MTCKLRRKNFQTHLKLHHVLIDQSSFHFSNILLMLRLQFVNLRNQVVLKKKKHEKSLIPFYIFLNEEITMSFAESDGIVPARY